MDETLLYKIGLTLLPKVGPITAKQLISYCGGAPAVFDTPVKTLLKIPGIGPSIAQKIRDKAILEKAEKELQFIQRHNIKPVYFLDEVYPKRLKQIDDCPIIIYNKGNADLNAEKVIAIVGTRSPSSHGTKFTRQFLSMLNLDNCLVISGLAYGIDTMAHTACVQEQIPTVGIMGHGFSTIYPATNKKLANEMTFNGALLTEHPFETLPEKNHFPRRNRIIAGMCDALIVVETGLKGGSMISAELANNYHKDVFAIPGRPGDQHSAGCNYLIKTHRASLLETADDLLYVMGWERGTTKNKQERLFPDLDEEEFRIVNLLKSGETVHVDLLATLSGFTQGKLLSILLGLEFKGMVKSLPGKVFALN